MQRCNLTAVINERQRSHTKIYKEQTMGRGILLWMLGVPLPIILLLAMCSHS
jgi:hypothetical protein